MGKPRMIGDWNLGRRLGGGGQSDVFEATRKGGEEKVALKLIRARNPKRRERFLRELQIHRELSLDQAENVVPVISSDVQKKPAGRLEGYIVMPLAAHTLQDLCPMLKGRLELTLEVFLGIVNGVRAAHAKDVVHRDIKPQNILFADALTLTPLVADFGICLVKDTPEDERLTETSEMVGARHFMAPEQERGGVVDVGKSADIYALGKLLHYMLTGRHLPREELGEAFTSQEIEQEPRLQRVLDEIVARTVATRPEERMQSADELFEVTQRLVQSFRTVQAGSASPKGAVVTTHATAEGSAGKAQEPVIEYYLRFADQLARGQQRLVSLQFDECRRQFEAVWVDLCGEVSRTPEQAPLAAKQLVARQPAVVGLTLAMARLDAVELFPDFRNLVEAIAHSTLGKSGNAAVLGIPCVQAGFLYMAAAVAGLSCEGWSVFTKLLTVPFQFSEVGGYVVYQYGFAHRYLMRPRALGTRLVPAKLHDLCREQLSAPRIAEVTGLRGDVLQQTYAQAQMLMCLRAAQLIERGEEVDVWPDYGRFYKHYVTSLLERAHSDHDYATGLSRAYDETPEEFLARAGKRLGLMHGRFGHSEYYDWASVATWEPPGIGA